MIIDHCYERVITQLTKQGRINCISKNLKSFKSNDQRVFYVYDIFKELNAFPTIELVNKSEEVSTYYRNLGNNSYKNMKIFEAWQYYNLSLLFAPLKTKSYCLSLSNRSAVFFAMKKYKESIVDIESCFSMEYPENLKDKLLKRQEQCKQFILQEEKAPKEDVVNPEIEDILTMKAERDPRYPNASTKLKLVHSQDLGRHVVAKEDIRVGELLVDEEPYFILVLKSQILFCCNYCLSRKFNLIPCDTCCFAFYCSEQCKTSAWKDYHSVECSLMATLIDMNFTKLELLALRTVIKARNDHSSWSALFQTIEEAEKNRNTEFQGHVKVGDKWVYDSKYYTPIHTLESNIGKRSMSDIFQKAVTAVVFLNLLAEGTDFMKSASEVEAEKIRSCVAGGLLLHIMTSPTNMHGITSNIQTADGNCVDEFSIASAPYPFLSLLNHSCAPNVVRFSTLGTGRMKMFALRPIKKGKQVLDNYGSHHALEDRGSRQTTLKYQYKFNCICEACVNDWPTYMDMKPSKKLPAKLNRTKTKVLNTNTIDNLQKGDKSTAVKVFSRLCSLCEELDPYAPCKELSECQEALKQCLVIFDGIVPFGHIEVINWSAKPPENLLH